MSPTLTSLTDSQKVAIVIAQLDFEQQNDVLSKFSEAEVVRVMAELANLPAISHELVKEVVGEVLTSISDLYRTKQGGLEVAEQLLRHRLGDRRAAELIDRLRDTAPLEAPLSFINRIDAQQIVGVCTNENPQAVAIVLAHIEPGLAADVIGRLDEEVRSEVALRIAKLGSIPTAVVKRLADVLEQHLSTFVRSGASSTAVNGVTAAVHILSNTDRTTEKQMIGKLEQYDPEIAERIRSEMFGWEDVVKLDDRTLQRVLQETTMPGLARALKNKDAETIEKFRRNLSERQLSDLQEEIDALGKIRLSEVEHEEGAIVKNVRRLADSGEIDIMRAENEVLV